MRAAGGNIKTNPTIRKKGFIDIRKKDFDKFKNKPAHIKAS